MHFYLTGIDHKAAPLDVRDIVYRRRRAISGFWAGRDLSGSAILTTCNRLEIYGVTENADEACAHIAEFFRDFPDFSRYAYVRHGEAAVFHHALRLATGLESQLIGEAQILLQLTRWIYGHGIPRPIRGLFEQAIALSEGIRAASGLNQDKDNLATLIYDNINHYLEPGRGYEVVVVGTGKVAELFARHRSANMRLSFAAHKNYQQACMLSGYSGGRALHLTDLAQAIAGSDVVIGATASPHYVLRRGHFVNVGFARTRPLYVYDLALPRGVEPEVGEINYVRLFNLRDLGNVFKRHQELRREKIELASGLAEDLSRKHCEVVYG